MKVPPVEAKVTFVVFKGEVVAIFRAYKASGEPWEKQCIRTYEFFGRRITECYTHVGQHGECDVRLLKCRRATPDEYKPLLEELNGVGYKVVPHQSGRLTLKDKTKGNRK